MRLNKNPEVIRAAIKIMLFGIAVIVYALALKKGC
jgi:hypothetical protein